MTATRLNSFWGMVPIMDERLLPAGAAAYSENVRPTGGNLRGYRPDLLVHTCLSNTTKNVFRIPNTIGEALATTFANSTWMEFQSQYVDVLRTPVVDDVFQRYYWASPDFVPQYNTVARIRNGDPAYNLGIPAPSHAPNVVASGGASSVAVSRSYLTTWVSAYGEEGPAGVPSAAINGKQDDNWNITLTPPDAGEQANRNLTLVRLYRTVTASTGQTTYFLVDELAIGTTNYLDEVDDTQASANSELQSTTWVGPPALQGMVAMPNGVFAGWVGNTVYFCEPFRPHAWPAEYALTVDFPIVGLGVFGQSLVVLTSGNPTVITGVDPSQMSEVKSQSFEPCLARSSIVSAPNGVTYASPNGLVFISSGSVQNITESSIDKEMWLQSVVPSTLLAVYYKSGYLGLNGPRAGAGSGMFMGLNSLGFNAYTGQVQQVGFNWVKDTRNIQNVQIDPWTGEVIVLYDSGGARKVFRFDPSDQTNGMNSYTWKSALFQLPKMDNLGAGKLVFTVPDGLDPADQNVTLKVYADGVLVLTRTVDTSGKIFRMPSGFKAEFWQFEITSKVIVHSLEVAASFRELASA
jgi:hypothetical protein